MAAKLRKLCFFDDEISDDDDSKSGEDEEEEEEEKEETVPPRKDSSPSLNRVGEKRKLAQSNEVGVQSLSSLSSVLNGSSSRPVIEEKKRLPLPSAFLSSSSSSPTVGSLSSSSDGRVRTFEHVRGNWASHVYLKPFEDGDDSIRDLAEEIAETMTGPLETGIKVHPLPLDDLHLSLSRTFVLGHHLIPPFTESLSSSLANTSSTLRGGSSNNNNAFLLAFSSNVKIYFNDEKTRGFIAIQVHPTCVKRLKHLVSAVDRTLKEFNLSDQLFYSDPSFHLSLAWFLPPEKINPLPSAGAKEGLIDEDDDDKGENESTQITANSSFTSSQSLSIPSSDVSSPTSSSTSLPPSYPLDPLLPQNLVALERVLSSKVADHFRGGAGEEQENEEKEEEEKKEESSRTAPVADSDADAANAASIAVWIKRVWLKTGNKLLSFPL